MNLEKLISDFLETGGKIKKCRTATAKGSKVLKMVKLQEIIPGML